MGRVKGKRKLKYRKTKGEEGVGVQRKRKG
jgi:hypothetical protein